MPSSNRRPVCWEHGGIFEEKNGLMSHAIFLFVKEGSLYEGGWFDVLLHFPAECPLKPPSVHFLTRIVHPNIYRGNAHVDFMKTGWKPCFTVPYILMAISSLLMHPDENTCFIGEAEVLIDKDKKKRLRFITDNTKKQQLKRLQDEVANDKMTVHPLDSDLLHWHGLLDGPENSPYEGGTFHFILDFSGGYPVKPPKVWFCTHIFHPNIDLDGNICVETLTFDPMSPWTMLEVLQALSNLLLEPKTDLLANKKADALYVEDREKFYDKAAVYTILYASTHDETPVTESKKIS